MSDARVSSADFFFCRAEAVSSSQLPVCLPLTMWEVPHSSPLSPTYTIRRLVRTAVLTGGISFLVILISIPSAIIVGVKVFFFF